MTKMDPKIILARLAKLTGSVNGLDACSMFAQYSSPFIIALLLRLSRIRSSLTSAAAEKVVVGHGVLGTVEGVRNVAGALGDARAVMRAFGLAPVLLGLMKLHPQPLRSISAISGAKTSPKTVPTVQLLSLVGFYSMDHLTWLAGKGVLSLDAARTKQLGLWGTRCWALYVMLELYKLNQTYSALRTRTRAAQIAKPVVSPREAEGYEIPVAGSSAGGWDEKTSSSVHLDKDLLRRDWDAWRLASLTNWSFAPLTLHWSVDGGLWSNPVITYSLGTMAALGRVASSWSATGI